MNNADNSDFASEVEQLSENTSSDAQQKQALRAKRDKILTRALVSMIVLLVLVVSLRIFVVNGIVVSGESMMPNFTDGTVVWVNKCATPKRGDVVVFYRNDVNKFQAEFAIGNDDDRYEKLIKRVVALEGDKLWVETRGNDLILKIQTTDGVITENYYTVKGEKASFYDANGNITDIPYLGFAGNLKGTTQENPFVVSENCFYAMGDNRHNSNDSRLLGQFPLSRLYGVVIGN